jgi:gliding motility-associated-like protein
LASQITEPLINTTDNEKIVEYIITPYLGDCAGTPFSYKVTVLPTPAIQSAKEITACNRASVGYFVDIRPNVASYFSWSREAKDGISNAAVSGQESRNIQESLENTTNLPIDVYYTFTYGTASCEGTPFTLKVTVNPAVYVNSDPDKQVCSGEPVAYNITSNVDQLGATFKWIRVNDLDGQPRGTDYTFSNTINEILINNSVTDVQHAYYSIIPILGDCEGEAFPFHVILKPAVKKPDVRDNGPVCLDKEIILHTDLVAGAQYLWTTSTGIINQRTDLPSLAIPATSAGPVKYYVTVVVDGCSNTSDEESLNVNQKPTVDVGEEQRTLCPDETRIPLNGQAFGNVDGSPIAGRWTKVKGSGIIELDGTIKANAYIPSAEDKAPGAEPVVLQFQSANGDDCEPAIKLVTITFEQARPTDTEAERTLEKCSGEPVNYEIVTTGDAAPNITYSWVRADDPTHNGISKRIEEVLVNNGTTDLTFTYNITPTLGDCVGETFPLRVTVKPAIAKPDFSYPQTVCVNKPFELTYLGNVANATFIWIGPDGTRQPETTNPTLSVAGISSPDQASFTLIIKVGNCEVASEQHTVDITPIPVVNAGADMPYCPDVSTIPLNGIVTRGVNGPPSDGIWVVLTGKGQFASNARVLNNQYQVHPDDIATGVVLQLQSTDNCDGVTPDVVTFTFQAVKVANAGPDREACEQRVQLNGQITAPSGTGRWEGGEGDFIGGRTSLTAMYIPSLNEVNARRVVLRLIADDNSLCNEKTDEVVITLLPPPTVMADASPVRYVVKGRTITLNPVVSEENLIYTWTESPMVGGISNTAIKNPVITGSGVDVTYTLTVTNPLLCESESSSVLVRASPQLEPKNTFTPNADGINDIWVIDGVEAYPNVVVDIYTRAGQPVYHSVGYAQPWDGTSNGKPVPFGVYYFVIDTKEVEQKVTGYVTVIR